MCYLGQPHKYYKKYSAASTDETYYTTNLLAVQLSHVLLGCSEYNLHGAANLACFYFDVPNSGTRFGVQIKPFCTPYLSYHSCACANGRYCYTTPAKAFLFAREVCLLLSRK